MKTDTLLTARRRVLLPVGVCAALAFSLAPAHASSAVEPRQLTPEEQVAEHLETIRGDHEALRSFVEELPKGGDLHNHLSGAASTELLIEIAADDGLCVEEATGTAVPPPCNSGTRPAADALTDEEFRQQVIREWSMEGFPRDESGHDHFFATFGKFGEVTHGNTGRLLAGVANDVVEQNQFYLETLYTPASDEGRDLAERVGYHKDPAEMHAALAADGGLDKLTATAKAEADAVLEEFNETAQCDTAAPDPGCSLEIRFNSQVSRASSMERVFTQMALGMRLSEEDPRFAGVNLVQPEDDEASLANYREQMRMLNWLQQRYPDARLTLHAGELTADLVEPEHLGWHIRDAVEVAGAERIGHGVDVRHDTDPGGLMREMARRGVAVEVPFTSNRQILQVSGDDHPFQEYRAHGVPVVLATDDPGVSRIDISHEYQYATETYGLTYPELKELARNSLEYSFLEGPGIWQDGTRVGPCAADQPVASAAPGERCRAFLSNSPKAAVQWQQEVAFAVFEHRTVRAGQPVG